MEIKDAVATDMQFEIVPYVIGFIIAAVVGVCAIKMVAWLIKSEKFRIFA